MSWLNEFLEKAGLGEVAKLHSNSPDKKPDDFDIEKAASDYLETRVKIYKSSDEFKNYGKEQQIVALKQYKKTLNDELGIGLSGEEAATLDPKDFNSKVKEKIQADIELAKNGRTSEWQDKYGKVEKEFNDFKKLHENTVLEFTGKLTEAENRYKEDVARHKRESIFSDTFSKLDFGKDEAHKENAKIILKTIISESGIKFKEDGRVYKGEADVVTTKDGHTVLKNLDDVFNYYGSERKLFPQSNAGATPQPGGAPAPTGNAELDKRIQADLQQLEVLNKTR